MRSTDAIMMKEWLRAVLLTGVLCMIFSTDAQAAAQSAFYGAGQEKLTAEEVAQNFADYDVIIFGEYHDNQTIHQQELAILTHLYQQDPVLILSLEMFERDVQHHLDAYLIGQATETEFLAASRPWQNYSEDYSPCVEFAKARQMPVLGGNIPRYIAAQYAKSGNLAELDEAKKRYLPERHVIEKNAYYEAFCEYMKSGQVGMKLSDEQIERYYQAQCLKDDAMAESIVNALGKEPHKTVLHLQGEFHGRNRLGVVEKIQKLNPKLRIGLISPVYVKTGTEIENAVHHLAVGDVVLAVNQ